MLKRRVIQGASASVFALMLMSSLAFADGTDIDAGIGEETITTEDAQTSGEALPEQIRGECSSETCDDFSEEYPEMIPVEFAGLDPVIYQNEAIGGPASGPVVRADSDNDVANTGDIPNLCDTAGPGWNWLCGVN